MASAGSLGAAAAGGANLWQQMLRDCSVRTKLPQANLLVVGDAQSGKTALLSRLNQHGAAGADAPAPGDVDDGNDSLLAFSTINVIDPKARNAGGDAAGTVSSAQECWMRRRTSISGRWLCEYGNCGLRSRCMCWADDVMAKIGTWTLNELKLKELVRIAVKPQDLAQVLWTSAALGERSLTAVLQIRSLARGCVND